MADPAFRRTPPLQPSLFGDADTLGYAGCGVWDEMVTGTGRLRPCWQRFLSAHGPFAPDAMAVRWEAARRILFQNGVTYTAYADPQGSAQGMERPWPLDPIPYLLCADEWRELASGLAQRARLLELVLADLYGPQRLLATGVLPPGVVHADPGFLRACHGLMPPGGRFLTLYAADLVRGPDGRWRVLASRTQSPTGAGYALENRVVLGQTLNDAFRACNVERIGPFLDQLKATLGRLAPRASGPDGSPRAVLLTPGPFNEAFFEHAYLARHLGLTLVEGADLTVRDQAVYLKTLGGLGRVDVILRRVDDTFCDPLELRPDSALGVPGLVQAVRAGTVAVANALGTGLTDSPALIPFMPALGRALLGEDLLLPDVETLWGGEPWQLDRMLARLPELSLRPAFSPLAGRAVFGPDLSAAQLSDLARRIGAEPVHWVAQASPPLSTVPVWRDGQAEPKPLVLRAFLCATGDSAEGDGEAWVAMPGGLARISADHRYPAVSLQEGAGAKDTWVVNTSPCQPARRRAHPPEAGGREPSPVSGDLPSRAADHLFWAGRYGERADQTVRILRAATARLADDTRPGALEELSPLLRLMGWVGLVPMQIAGLGGADGPRAVRLALEVACDPANPGGLWATLERLRRAGAAVRDRLSPDLGRVLAQLGTLATAIPGKDPAALALRLDDLAMALAALAGLEQDGMSRSHGWRFLVLGRRLERAVGLLSGLRGTGLVGAAVPPVPALEVLLELAEARSAYRERFPAGVRPAQALSVLLADGEHPRSLLFQMEALAYQLSALPWPAGSQRSPTADAVVIVEEALVLVRDPEACRDASRLATLVDRLDAALPEMSNLLSQAYFSHVFARTT